MYRQLFERVRAKLTKEHGLLAGAIILTVSMSMWINQRTPQNDGGPVELGTVIPKGFLMIPLELANRNSLAGLITHNAVIDVFQPGQTVALAENLRVLKLQQEEGVLFGALVPAEMAGPLQEVFGRPKLKGAMRTMDAGPTKFHIPKSNHSLVTEISVEEGL
jgi:hypothetical protein